MEDSGKGDFVLLIYGTDQIKFANGLQLFTKALGSQSGYELREVQYTNFAKHYESR